MRSEATTVYYYSIRINNASSARRFAPTAARFSQLQYLNLTNTHLDRNYSNITDFVNSCNLVNIEELVLAKTQLSGDILTPSSRQGVHEVRLDLERRQRAA